VTHTAGRLHTLGPIKAAIPLPRRELGLPGDYGRLMRCKAYPLRGTLVIPGEHTAVGLDRLRMTSHRWDISTRQPIRRIATLAI
jgi:hypothetical protein